MQHGTGAATPLGSNTHGTHVAGIAIGGPRASSHPSQGAASGASLIAANVFDTSGRAYTSDIYAALEWIIALKVSNPVLPLDAVNMSLGISVPYSGDCDASFPTYKAFFDQLRSLGVVPVVSAGNDGWRSSMGAPACVSSALSVTSSKRINNEYAYYSNISLTTDIVAPGGDISDGGGIMSSIANTMCDGVPNSLYCMLQGTSMAAPHVAGVVAALRSALPAAGVAEIEAALKSTAVMMPDTRSGGMFTKPRIQVDQALRALTKTSESTFAGWSGDCRGTGLTCSLTMNSAKSVNATFNIKPTRYYLTVARTGEGTGRIVSSPAALDCDRTCTAAFEEGTAVTLTAVAGPASNFTGWSGCDRSSGLSCSVVVSAGRAVSAEFASTSCNNLPCALDSNLPWTTYYTNAPFFSQGSYVSGMSGTRAARSGSTPDNGITCMASKINLPGILDVVWSPSSEDNSDWLFLLIDDLVAAAYTGEAAMWGIWMNDVFEIDGSGTVPIDFCYFKDSSGSSNLDAGFVDRAFYTQTGPASAQAAGTVAPTVTHAISRMLDRNGKSIAPSANMVTAWPKHLAAPSRTRGKKALPQHVPARP